MLRNRRLSATCLAFAYLLVTTCLVESGVSQTSPDPGAAPPGCNPRTTYDTASRCQQPSSIPNSRTSNYESRSKSLIDVKKRKELVARLYRPASKSELDAIRVEKSDADRYRTSLADKAFNLFRLVRDSKCGTDVSGPACSKYTMPGNGSSYSFRERTYRIPRLADVTYSNHVLNAGSRYTLGIMTELGDVDLLTLSLESQRVRTLRDMNVFDEPSKIEEEFRKFEKNPVIGAYHYSNSVVPVVGRVYLLRSIAYRTMSAQRNLDIVYDEFEFDKRSDVMVAFEIVRIDDDDGITILSKVIDERESPRLQKRN